MTRIDNHVHLGVDPLFYLRGHSPYALDVERLLLEAEGHGIDEWVVFPFVSYVALDQSALRDGRIEAGTAPGNIPYKFENERLARELGRLPEGLRKKFRQFLMADPARQPASQVRGGKHSKSTSVSTASRFRQRSSSRRSQACLRRAPACWISRRSAGFRF